MAKTKTSSAVKNRYNAKAYDQLPIRVPKGKKADLQAHAATKNESLNGFVNRAIDEAVERDITPEHRKHLNELPMVADMGVPHNRGCD